MQDACRQRKVYPGLSRGCGYIQGPGKRYLKDRLMRYDFCRSTLTEAELRSEEEFPIVLTSKISYEHYSDTLVAATFGRGIYVMKNGAKEALLDALGSESRVKETSSAEFFPKQL